VEVSVAQALRNARRSCPIGAGFAGGGRGPRPCLARRRAIASGAVATAKPGATSPSPSADRANITLPRDLWHGVLFVTAGEIARETIRELGGETYEPHIYAQGLFERSWPELRAPLERFWLPYVRGEGSLENAAAALAGAYRGAADTKPKP